jgi:PAP2 superfamily
MNKLPSMLRWLLHYNLLAVLILIGYVALAVALSRIFGFPLRLDVYSYTLLLAVCAVAVVYVTAISIIAVWVHRPSRPIRFLLSRLVLVHRVPERVLVAAPVLLLLPLFFSAFTSVKSAIGVINPYSWDRTFMELDLTLHGGRAPGMLLQSVGYPLLTFGLSFFYNLWFVVMTAVLVIAAFSIHRPRLRSQYLICFVLAWTILGTIGAIVFASMGPCFFDLAYPGEDNPFEPLMAYLKEVNQIYPVWALTAQDMLREYYLGNRLGLGAGISAFPSMHVAVAVLNAILGWHLSRTAGWLLTIFAVLVMIGSVHLGWHYAVDDYASALTILPLWKLSGIIVERWHAHTRFVEAANPV